MPVMKDSFRLVTFACSPLCAVRLGGARLVIVLAFLLPGTGWCQISVENHGEPQTLNSRISIARLRVPRDARDLYEKAKKALSKHKYVEAQAALNDALHRYPTFPEALTLSATIQLEIDQWEAAEQSLQAAVQIDPNYGMAYLVLADLYNRERHFDIALKPARRAVALIPDYWPAAYELARALIGKRQYELALSITGASLGTNPETVLRVEKAHCLIELGRYAEAITELQTYLRYEPAGEASRDAQLLLDTMQNGTNHEPR